ncbi:MAG: signal recognition particle-docking protein FtsY [Colwellia sp.]|nr:signal recognition particle-docking protein FtsY [Colwellia sp.]
MFSWLGFGQDEKEQATHEDSQAVEESTPESELVADTEQSEAVVEDVVIAEPATSPTIPQDMVPEAELSAPIDEPEEQEAPTAEITEPEEQMAVAINQPEKTAKLGFFARLKQGLTKTRQNLGGGLFDLFRGKQIDDELFEELETHLLLADVGVETTMKIIDSLTKSASRKQLKDAEALYELLKSELKKIIGDVSQPLEIPESDEPFVLLMVGVNGVGKTTTIGKLAKQFQAEGKSVMLAAGDTFRAAAVEQLQVWGERNDIPVIAQHSGADSASVIFDAISAAKARKVDVLIADTAGRLQNKAHLMEELKKVVRVMKKLDVNAPHEVMLTLDAGTGQNALSQTKLFDEAVGLTGLTITKLDGTAKGGVVFAIADKHSIPIRYLGVGEGIDDLRPFNGDDFIDALFTKE